MIHLVLALSLAQCPGGQCPGGQCYPPQGYACPPGFGQRLFGQPQQQQQFMRPPSNQLDQARQQITQQFQQLQSQLDTLEADVKALKAQPGCQCPKSGNQPAPTAPAVPTPTPPTAPAPTKGEQGQQGPAGPQGPAGQGIDQATLQKLIADALAKQPQQPAQRIRIIPVPPTQQGQ